jgi:hypothetical protein
MTGRYERSTRQTDPGFYDAGEAAMGIKHVMLVKKPDAFQLGSDNPDDPKVQEDAGPTRALRTKLQSCQREFSW